MSKSYADGARSGAEGNTRLLKDYGGSKGSDGMSKCYAHGGSVHSEKKEHKHHKAEGGEVDGMPAKGRLDRPGRKMKGKDGKGKGTNVNVIIMSGKGDAGAGPMPGGPPPGAMAGPPPMPPKPPMPMGGPPMAGAPPPMPPMHKNGGRVGAFKNGGSIRADGQTSKTEKEAEDEEVDGRANGGSVKASGQTDATEAEAINAKKSGGKICKADGGRVPHLDAGAGGARGRMEKMKAYGS